MRLQTSASGLRIRANARQTSAVTLPVSTRCLQDSGAGFPKMEKPPQTSDGPFPISPIRRAFFGPPIEHKGTQRERVMFKIVAHASPSRRIDSQRHQAACGRAWAGFCRPFHRIEEQLHRAVCAAQLLTIGEVKSEKTDAAEARYALEDQLMDNLLTLAIQFKRNPAAGMAYFDQRSSAPLTAQMTKSRR